MSRMFTASVVPAAWVGRSVPMALETSILVMFALSLQTANAVPPSTTTSTPTSPMTPQRRQRRAGRRWISRRLITGSEARAGVGESWSVWPTSPSSVVLRVVVPATGRQPPGILTTGSGWSDPRRWEGVRRVRHPPDAVSGRPSAGARHPPLGSPSVPGGRLLDRLALAQHREEVARPGPRPRSPSCPARVVVFVDDSGTTRLSAWSEETFRIVERIR